MDKQEKVVCAAIACKYIHDVGGIASVIVPGIDWESIRASKLFHGVYHSNEFLEFDKGFLTNKNRFVDPVEAQKIAIVSGQYIDPHKEIAQLETAIDGHWFNVEHAKSQAVISSLKTYIRQDTARLEELKSGYLGDSLRVEDLY